MDFEKLKNSSYKDINNAVVEELKDIYNKNTYEVNNEYTRHDLSFKLMNVFKELETNRIAVNCQAMVSSFDENKLPMQLTVKYTLSYTKNYNTINFG